MRLSAAITKAKLAIKNHVEKTNIKVHVNFLGSNPLPDDWQGACLNISVLTPVATEPAQQPPTATPKTTVDSLII